jgi:hypothetical protein
MNLDEFRKKAKEIRDEAEREVKKLGKDLAFNNASAKIGDIVTAKYGNKVSIIVDDIKFTMKSYLAREESPECVYFGYVLTKAGKPRKDGERGRIYESDLLK